MASGQFWPGSGQNGARATVYCGRCGHIVQRCGRIVRRCGCVERRLWSNRERIVGVYEAVGHARGVECGGWIAVAVEED